MTTILLNLLWIHLIVILVFHSGFVDSIEEAVYRKFKPYRLGKPWVCSLCMTNWLSILWLLCTGNFSLMTLVLALTSAILTTVTVPLLKTVENYLLHFVELLNRLIL